MHIGLIDANTKSLIIYNMKTQSISTSYSIPSSNEVKSMLFQQIS